MKWYKNEDRFMKTSMNKQLDICRKCPQFEDMKKKHYYSVSCGVDEVLTFNGLSIGRRMYTVRQYVRTDVPRGCSCMMEYIVMNGKHE